MTVSANLQTLRAQPRPDHAARASHLTHRASAALDRLALPCQPRRSAVAVRCPEQATLTPAKRLLIPGLGAAIPAYALDSEARCKPSD